MKIGSCAWFIGNLGGKICIEVGVTFAQLLFKGGQNCEPVGQNLML